MTEFGTGALAISQMFYSICMKVLGVTRYACHYNLFLRVLFGCTIWFIWLNLLYEGSKLILHAAHKSPWALASPDFLRKLLRACIFSGLALGAHAVLVTSDGLDASETYILASVPGFSDFTLGEKFRAANMKPFTYFKYDPDTLNDIQTTLRDALASSSDEDIAKQAFIDAVKQSNLTPEAMVSAVGLSINDTAKRLNAFDAVDSIQMESLVKLADGATQQVLDQARAQTGNAPVAAAPTTGSDSTMSKISSLIESAMNWFADLAYMILNAGGGFLIALGYLCMDVVVTKVLWMNTIYLAVSYLVCLYILPMALLLAYWPSTQQILVGVTKHIIICVLTLKFLTIALASVVGVSPILQAIKDSQPPKVDYSPAMLSMVWQQYAELRDQHSIVVGSDTYQVNPVELKKRVETRIRTQGPASLSMDHSGITLMYPVIALMAIGFMVSVVGKLSTIIQDTLQGTMTYHKTG